MSSAAGIMVMTMEAQFEVCMMALPGQNQVELEYRSRMTEELSGYHVFLEDEKKEKMVGMMMRKENSERGQGGVDERHFRPVLLSAKSFAAFDHLS